MPEPLRSIDDVRAWLADHVYAPRPDDDVRGAVGLEAELFPFWVTPAGRPAARLALVEIIGVVDGVAGVVRRPDAPDGRPSWLLDGVLVTEEPGAQVEVAGPPELDAGTAIAGIDAVVGRLAAAFDAAGAGLAAAGLDCWSAPEDVPVQLEVPRYRAMTTYFGRRGGDEGHLLMCASCSLQVNLDLGPPAVAPRRWLLANLAAPVLVAAFAASPGAGRVNARAMGWLGLDPTRTGIAPPLRDGVDDPLEHALADALRADVLLVERGGQALAGEPGWSFGRWLAEGHPRYGRPTTADLRTHLTTLFPEARLRRYVEVRGVDALPGRWRGAAVALVVGLLYDETAREHALDLLLSWRAVLPQRLRQAACHGLRDPEVGATAAEVLEAALAGAERLGIPQAVDAEAYLETYTARRRHPSDDLRAALAEGPAAAFAWARA
ncbi:MAG TPA: glutamate-cysteine ligase family protein [Egibacteraceae bacterium]